MFGLIKIVAKGLRYIGRRRDRIRSGLMILTASEGKIRDRKGESLSRIERFMKSLRWKQDNLKGFFDYAREPVITVANGGGDCEDLALLWRELINEFDYETRLFAVYPKSYRGHVMLAVKPRDKKDTYYVMSNREYSRYTASSFREVMKEAGSKFYKDAWQIILYDENDYPDRRI